MTDQPASAAKGNMPDEIWLSSWDTCVAFDTEEDARSIGHTDNPVRYTRAAPQGDAVDAPDPGMREKLGSARMSIDAPCRQLTVLALTSAGGNADESKTYAVMAGHLQKALAILDELTVEG